MSSTDERRATAATRAGPARTRDPDGRFLPRGARRTAKTERNVEAAERLRTERDYLKRIVQVFGEDDVEAVVRAIRHDAVGEGDVDVKVVNAAREWIGKYLLGNARVSLDDVQRQPAIVKRK